jgi:hypothetical protein
VDAVGGVEHRDLGGDFVSLPQLNLRSTGHEFVF